MTCPGGGAPQAVWSSVVWASRTRIASYPLTNAPWSVERMHEVLKVDLDEWRAEIPLIREFFDQFGDKLPEELRVALDGLEGRIERG